MGNARIGFKKYKGFRKALSKNEAQTCTECMARGCTGGTHARRRALIERELVNIMTAIKAGILTSTTKAELEKLEAERDRLLQNGLGQQTKADTVATILPNAIGRSKAMLAAWLQEYERLKGTVYEDYGVKLPDLGHIYLSPKDVTEFCENVFRQNAFGSSLLRDEDR